MKLADYLAQIAEIEARIAANTMRHDDIVCLRRAVVAWDRGGRPDSGALFAAFEAARRAVDLSVTKALECALAEIARRDLIEKLRREIDELDREGNRQAIIAARQARTTKARARYEHGAAAVA